MEPEVNDPTLGLGSVAGPWRRDVTLLCARSRVIVGGWERFLVV